MLRPGGLTDDPGTGRVTLDRRVERGSIPRDDVAATLLALLDIEQDGRVLRWSAARPRSPRRWPRSANYGGRG
ncbi:MAG: SDR family oxidoreductase [Actinomycetota bacterium]|nr:SDR family oxidoreductase [Actinomycetota bacterium]